MEILFCNGRCRDDSAGHFVESGLGTLGIFHHMLLLRRAVVPSGDGRFDSRTTDTRIAGLDQAISDRHFAADLPVFFPTAGRRVYLQHHGMDWEIFKQLPPALV